MYRCTCSLTSAPGGVNCQRHALPPQREPVANVQEAGLAPGPGWTCEERSAVLTALFRPKPSNGCFLYLNLEIL